MERQMVDSILHDASRFVVAYDEFDESTRDNAISVPERESADMVSL
jgi:hypothetical protein